MPGMSGFELLSAVRRLFPAIRVIAMSGACFSGGVPPGIAADAYYAKGGNVASLVEMVENATAPERLSLLPSPRTTAPLWIPVDGDGETPSAPVVIACPHCLRTFPLLVSAAAQLIQKGECPHCAAVVEYGLFQPLPHITHSPRPPIGALLPRQDESPASGS